MRLDGMLRPVSAQGPNAVGAGGPPASASAPGPFVPSLPEKVIVVAKDVIRNFSHTKRVGNYLLGKTLGEGSFAKVKEGLHILTGEKVAVKVIDKKKAKEDAYVRKNMRREGKLLQAVRHQNVVRLYEIMETENSYYLVCELCEGGDLMDHICNKKRLEERETRRYIRQVTSAVDYLHKAGILHRDLKVENLLLDENKDIKIIDFGLSNAVRVSHTKETSTVQEFCVTQCGSPAYAAPELLGNKKYGPEVDIWSVGVNMYAMLTGNLPFTVEPFNIKALHRKMLNGEMNNIPEHLSSCCQDLLKKFLAPDPKDRVTLKEIMQHPWITENSNRVMEPAPFPNKLSADDMNHNIVKYMSQSLGYRMGDVIRLVTSNIPSSATATYHMFDKRLKAYEAERRVKGRVSAVDRSVLTESNNKMHTPKPMHDIALVTMKNDQRKAVAPRNKPPSVSISRNTCLSRSPTPRANSPPKNSQRSLPKPTAVYPKLRTTSPGKQGRSSERLGDSQVHINTEVFKRARNADGRRTDVQLFKMPHSKTAHQGSRLKLVHTTIRPNKDPQEGHQTKAADSEKRDLPMIMPGNIVTPDTASRPLHVQKSSRASSAIKENGLSKDGAGSSRKGSELNEDQHSRNASEAAGNEVSQSSPRQTPRRYLIDVNHYERYARRGTTYTSASEARVFKQQDCSVKSPGAPRRKMTNSIYPTFTRSKSRHPTSVSYNSRPIDHLNVTGESAGTANNHRVMHRASVERNRVGDSGEDAVDNENKKEELPLIIPNVFEK